MKFITYIFLGVFTVYILTPLVIRLAKKSKNPGSFVMVEEESSTDSSCEVQQDLFFRQLAYYKTHRSTAPATIPDHSIYITDFSVFIDPVFPPPRSIV